MQSAAQNAHNLAIQEAWAAVDGTRQPTATTLRVVAEELECTIPDLLQALPRPVKPRIRCSATNASTLWMPGTEVAL